MSLVSLGKGADSEAPGVINEPLAAPGRRRQAEEEEEAGGTSLFLPQTLGTAVRGRTALVSTDVISKSGGE